MPEDSFRFMYRKFREESANDEKETLLRLMSYYEAPYMAVLIRSYELRLPEEETISEALMNMGNKQIREKLNDLWLDDRILDATKKDDYKHLEAAVERFGTEYVRDAYIKERTLQKVLLNMRALYAGIKGE